MARIRAVLFDIDGTLLDSNDAHAHAWIDSLLGHGHAIPFERVRSKIGMGVHRLLPAVTGIPSDSIEGRSIAERRSMILKSQYLPDAGPFHGARVLVDRLRSRGLTCIAVTSSSTDDAHDLLRAAGVADLMDVVITGDDLDRSREDADLLPIALDVVGVSPSSALLIGDTLYDVEAGMRASVPVVALRCGGSPERDLRGAIAVYDDPADLSSQLDRSPLALDRDSDPPARIYL